MPINLTEISIKQEKMDESPDESTISAVELLKVAFENSKSQPEVPESILDPQLVKVKEEPIENFSNSESEISIKEEQPDIINDPDSSSQILISTIKTELYEDDYQYEDSQYEFTDDCSIKKENPLEIQPEEDIFQYNVVNSFKSDLATRRNVSHTVVSGVQTKSPEEIAELARQELIKLEKEKQIEREKVAAAQAKSIALSASYTGPRYVARPTTSAVTPVRKPGRPPGIAPTNHQCPSCLIKFKTYEQLIAHKRIHDKSKAPLNTADMTKNIYEEVKMKIEQIGNRRSFHVLLPNYDYAFIVTNSTATKLYMKCFRQTCDVKAYSTTDGKFYLKKGEKHSHGPDKEIIVYKIDAAKKSILEKTNVINRQVHEAILEKQMQKNTLNLRKNLLIERIKRSQEIAFKAERDEDDEKSIAKKTKIC